MLQKMNLKFLKLLEKFQNAHLSYQERFLFLIFLENFNFLKLSNQHEL